MILDKETLQNQLNQFNGDMQGLTNTLAERSKQAQQIAVDIERMTGAKEYLGLVIGRLQQQIESLSKSEPPTTPPNAS